MTSSRPLTVGLVLAVTTFAFDSLAVTTAMPAIVDDLGGVALYGAAFSAFMLTNLVGVVAAGQAADRYGPGRPLAAGMACFAVGLVIAGVAPSMPVVVLGRAVQGLGGGAIGTCAYVVIGRGYPPEARARMFAVLSAAWIVPALLAPALAGVVAEHLHWRLVFLGLLPFPIVAAALALPALAHLALEPTETGPTGRIPTALRLAAGTGLLLTGLGEERLWLLVPLTIAGVAIALPALAALLPRGALRAEPGLPAVVATRGMVALAFFGTDAFVPLAITDVRGRTTLVAGIALTTASIAWSAAAWAQSRLAGRWSDRTVIRLGLALVGVGIALVATLLEPGLPLVIGFVGWTVAGAGMGLAYNAASVSALDQAPSRGEGATSAAVAIADAIGIAVGTGFGGAAVALGEAWEWSTATSLAIAFTATGIAVAVGLVAAGNLRSNVAGSRREAAA